MLRKITLSVAIGLFFFVTNTATAQIDRGRFSVHIGPTLPLGDFGDDDVKNIKALGAGVGLGLGIEYTYPLTETGVGLFFGIGVNYNTITSDSKEEAVEEGVYISNSILDNLGSFEISKIDEDDITFPKYFNIPISAGLNYTFKADDKLSVYTNLGLIYNFLKITDSTLDTPVTIYTSAGNVEIIERTVTYNLASSFGVKIGGGIILNDKIYISLNYFGLGKHKIKIKAKNEVKVSYRREIRSLKIRSKSKSEISMLSLTVGFRL